MGGAAEKNKTSVTTIVITTVVTVVVTAILTVIGTWIKQQWMDPFAFTVRVAYLDSHGNHVDLSDADVIPDINNVEGKKTNLYGEAVFTNVDPHPFRQATIEIKHPGYGYLNPPKAPVVPIRKRDSAVNILLQPLGTEGTTFPSSTQEFGVLPQKSTVVTSTCRSGLMASGRGKDFSQLYTLCSDSPSCSPPPPGPEYSIQSERFELTGDRRCNAWSQCSRESSSTEKKVCYDFEMQGHDEWQGPLGLGGSGVAYSEGILIVSWVRH